MANKRVVIIRNAAPTDFGGGERFPVFLAVALQNTGWQPLVISRSSKLLAFAKNSGALHQRGWWWSRQNWSGWRVLLTPLYFLWQIFLYFYYFGFFISYRPSVVHLQSKDDFIAGTFAARALGIRVVWTDHADLKHVWRNVRVWHKNPIGKLVYLAALAANLITVVSHSEERSVKRHLNSSSRINKKIVVVHNGVFDQKDSYPKKEPSEAVRFMMASRLVTDKGVGEAIEAFNRLLDDHDHVQLTIMGDGPERADLQTLPGAEKVKFLGHIDDPLAHLANADVFIHPTYHEGFSVALVEAGMMGLPIIATNVGGNVEIIEDKKTGLLIPPRDSLALYSAMKDLAGDKATRAEYGNAARRQFVREFEFNKIVNGKFIPLYEEDK